MNPDHNNLAGYENLLNFQNLTPEEYESLRSRYMELLFLNERLHGASVQKVKSMENETENRLPDEYLIAFEDGVEFCKNFVCNCIAGLVGAMQNYENQLRRESYEDEAYGEDSSDEIERIREVAKANNYRTKRSKFRPETLMIE